MRRSVHSWADAVNKIKRDVDLIHITLTYADVDGWRPRDINRFLTSLRRAYSILAYAWVAEVQARGALHYHLLLVVPAGVRLPMPDESYWHGGSSSIGLARGVGYLVTYVRKEYQKDFDMYPVGCRLYAVSYPAGTVLSVSVRVLEGWASDWDCLRMSRSFWDVADWLVLNAPYLDTG
jgi:hypothetical protein